MNWFRQNRFLGGFLLVFALLTIFSLYFLLHEKGQADEEQARLDSIAIDLNRLRASKPFPNPANLAKTKAQVAGYRESLGSLREELKARTLPVVPIQPNEFQTQLRQAVNSAVETAAANKVKLPDHFNLGFDEYATSLPNSTAAPLLGQELQAVAMMVDVLVNARVDALTGLTRTPLPEENPAPTPAPEKEARRSRGRIPAAAGKVAKVAPAVVSSHAIEIAFSANPTAARKVLNAVATAKEQLFIIRTLSVKNQAQKGPARGGEATATPPSGAQPAAGPAKTAAPNGIKFIVGTEHLDVKAKIEIVSLMPEKETR